MGKGANNTVKTGDLCWFDDSMTLSLDGSSNQIVRDDKTGAWKLADDDGSRLERRTGAANGDNDGEHWVLTTTDGTQYWFGLNRLPGWTAGKPETNSASTVPVFGNHTGEPCRATAFDASSCTQAWRWNLDQVVDTHGDAMTLWWAKETNHYGRNGKADKPVAYDRASNLARIDYAQRGDALFTSQPGARVHFETAERCLPTTGTGAFDCAPAKLTKDNAKHWPDVPFDLKCDASVAGTKCTDKYAPSFWTTKRLTKVTSEVLNGTAYAKADTWTLKQTFPVTDGTSPALWLDSVDRTGHTGGKDTSLPTVTFRGQMLDNRVDGFEGLEPFTRYRVQAVDTEHGSTVGVTYSPQECSNKPGSVKLPTAAHTNGMRCYPVHWTPEWAEKPLLDWFHKYVVTQVQEFDNVAGSLPQVTSYEYVGTPAWAYDTSELTEEKYRTYSQYRGYGKVRTLTGRGDDGKRGATEETYFRGMHGDRLPDGTTRAVDVADSEGNKAPDLLPYAGTPHDEYGMPVQVHDLGDVSDPADDACTTLTYVRNTDKWILDLESQERTVTGACGASGGEVVSDTRTLYDGKPFGQAPAKGDVTAVEELTGDGKGHQMAERTEYDVHGRPLASYDVDGNKTTTAYTPASGAIPTKTVVTNPLGHTETVFADPARGTTTAEVDANGRRTDVEYDGLGRVTKVWDISRDKAAGQSPSSEHGYAVSRTAPATVTTKSLRENGTYSTAVEIYDGLLRQRQSQDPGVGGGRIVVDSHYDTHGRVVKASEGYYTAEAPAAALLAVGDAQVPFQTRIVYDGLGRQVKESVHKYGDEQWATTAAYEGDATTVFPAGDDTVTTTFDDDEGRPVKLREYLDKARTTWQDTTYAYDRKGQLTKVTDPDGNEWAFEYDARGREVKSVDPDRGTTTTTYDKADRPVTTTDARGRKTSTTYDVLDRPTSLREGGTDGTKLVEWTYDSLLKGLPTASIRHHNGGQYRTEATGYDKNYRPTGAQLVVPATEGKLAGTYAYEYGYTPNTGLPQWTQSPQTGPLVKERIVTRYTAEDLPQTIAGLSVYATNLQYDATGELLRTELGAAGRKVYSTLFYDEHTRALTRTVHDRDGAAGTSGRIDDTGYTYDTAGNVTRITRTPGAAMPDAGPADTQCFSYDALQRMTEAWTGTDNCAAAPSKATVGGPQPYWQSYGFDAVGNRTKLVDRDPSGDTAKDVTRTYDYPGAGKPQPRALTKSESKGPKGTSADTFAYDATGNMTIRQTGGSVRTMDYDTKGNLAKVTEGNSSTEYLYDADGDRLIHRAPDGSTTLYLADAELTVDKAGKLSATRQYGLPDGSTVVRTASEGDGTSGRGTQDIVLADHHGTGQTAFGLDTAGAPVTRRMLKPFGEVRGEGGPTALPGKRGFVGGRENEDTGLTQLGAREYDPGAGRFTSVDPVIDFGNPQQMNPYAYANNAPATEEDAHGLFFPALVVGAVWAYRGYKAYKAVKKIKKAVKVVKKAVKPKQAKKAAKPAAKKRATVKRAQTVRKATQKKAQCVTRKAKPRTAAKSAPKRSAKYRSVSKQRPKASPHPRSRPKATPKPRQARPQASRGGSRNAGGKGQNAGSKARELKSELKDQAQDSVVEAVQEQATPCGSGCTAADGPQLNAQLVGEELSGADGHAFDKHVLKQGEFPGIRTRKQFAAMIEGVVLFGERRVAGNGRSAYWRKGVIVIRNPKSRDGGTVFTPKEGYGYFTKNFREE
ncbi:RHS repeat domain-containing protein [Streptomyces bacillaris]|uniref:RHS repeat domain-containing protein n=1 Tax=Streptomyces bacillaris TaxID=68179 RepID=UPI0035D74077